MASSDEERKVAKERKRSRKEKKEKKTTENLEEKQASRYKFNEHLNVKINANDVVDASALTHNDISDYLEIDFHDGTGYSTTDCLLPKDPVQNAKIYVEGLSSGMFRRANKMPNTQASELQSRSENSEYGPTSLVPLMNAISEYQGTFFLMCQGVLAGYAVLHMYSIFNVPEDDFLCTYAPIANETRRFIGIFCNMSLVAVVSKYMYMARDETAWVRYPKEQQILVKLTIAIYTAALVLSLVTAPTGAQMHLEDALDNSWCKTALNSPEYGEKIKVWKILSVCQFCCIFLGWLAVSLELLRDKTYRSEACKSAFDLNNLSLTTQPSLDESYRSQIRALSIQELKTIVALHKEALRVSEACLTSKASTTAEKIV